MQGNIITYIKNGELHGYLEFFRINFEQFGRKVCDLPIYALEEDILNGNIAYINNMWINPEDRNGDAFHMLAAMFLARNKDAEFFTAFRRLKKSEPVKVYRREDLIRFYSKGD